MDFQKDLLVCTGSISVHIQLSHFGSVCNLFGLHREGKQCTGASDRDVGRPFSPKMR